MPTKHLYLKALRIFNTSMFQNLLSGLADCVMALGFEKMQRGSLKAMVCSLLVYVAS